MMLSLERKSQECRIDQVIKFCRAGDLVLDTDTAILTTTNACLQLPELRRFVGPEKNSTCFQDAPVPLLEVDANQVSTTQSDMTWSEEEVEKGKVSVKKMAALPSMEKVNILVFPSVRARLQAFPVDNVHFLGIVYKDGQLHLRRAGTYLFCNGLISNTGDFMEWIWKHFWRVTFQLKKSRSRS